jgi:hypothetical protein
MELQFYKKSRSKISRIKNTIITNNNNENIIVKSDQGEITNIINSNNKYKNLIDNTVNNKGKSKRALNQKNDLNVTENKKKFTYFT